MSPLSKNIQKFLVVFFTATSVVLVFVGVTRIKKAEPLAATDTPPGATPLSPAVLAASVTIKGKAYQTPWGNAVASITIKDGKVIAASMPTVPNSPPSVYAEAFLVDQALKSGSANIQGVSGATYTSLAFKASLESALAEAQSQGQTITANAGDTVSAHTAKPSVPREYREDDDEDEDEEEDEWELD